jgi:hypothetical protein
MTILPFGNMFRLPTSQKVHINRELKLLCNLARKNAPHPTGQQRSDVQIKMIVVIARSEKLVAREMSANEIGEERSLANGSRFTTLT